MKLLFAVKSMTTPGGAERVLAQVASALAEAGHEVVLVSFDRQDSPDFYPVHPRVDRRWLRSARSDRPTSPWQFFRVIVGLKQESKAFRPDVAIGFMHSAYIPLALALAGTSIPVIGSEHTSVKHYSSRTLQRLLVRFAAPLMWRMTVPAETVREEYPRALAQKMTVIPNPVSASERRTGARAGPKRLLSIGRLGPEKGHSILLEAFAAIAADHPEWQLRLVGEGPMIAALKDQAADLNLGPRVEFAGLVRDVAEEYASADLYVVPSSYESFGLATAEALAAGLPAVGFMDCPGVNVLIADGVNGSLVSPGSNRPQALARSLDFLMSAPQAREQLAMAAPGTVKQYTVEAAVDGWRRLLAEADQPSP